MALGAIAIGARAALQGRRRKNPQGAAAKPRTQLTEATWIPDQAETVRSDRFPSEARAGGAAASARGVCSSLLRVPSGSDKTLRAVREGAGG